MKLGLSLRIGGDRATFRIGVRIGVRKGIGVRSGIGFHARCNASESESESGLGFLSEGSVGFGFDIRVGSRGSCLVESDVSSKSESDSGSELGSASPEGVEHCLWQRIRNARSQKQSQTRSQVGVGISVGISTVLWGRNISFAFGLRALSRSRHRSGCRSRSRDRRPERKNSWLWCCTGKWERYPFRIGVRIGVRGRIGAFHVAVLRCRKQSRDLAPCPGEALVSASTSESDAGSAVGGGVGWELEVGAGFGIGLRVGFARSCGALALAADSDYL